jgi:hypothetical protein
MTVTCKNLKDFIEVTSGYAREGVTFTADTQTLTITLTGGF